MAIDSSLVFYSALGTSTIPIVTGQDLQTILQNIDTAINTHNTAPDYTSYNLYCITQTDGITHPTNTQNFAEGISKIVCDNADVVDAFINTTYVSDQAVLTSAITALQTPGLTYSYTGGGGSIAVTNGMTRNQVLTATYTGVGNILALLNAPGTTWATLSISTPTNISTAFNSLITYLSSLTTTVSGKQAQISTFNNSANCLAGTSTDTIYTTVGLIIPYLCALPTYDAGNVTWYGVTPGTDIESSVQNLVNTSSYLLTNAVVSNGTGLSIAAVGSTYQGKELSIDDSYTQLYKVMVTGDAYTDADVLDQKVMSSDSSITFAVTGNKLDAIVSIPANGKIKVTAADSNPDYISVKLASGIDTVWGMGITANTQGDNKMILTPTIANPDLTWQAMMYYIASDPTLLTQFANLVSTSASVPGLAVTDLVVTLTTGDFVLTWTPQTGVSQQAKWRPRSNAVWYTTVLTPANPLSAVATTTTYPSAPVNDPQQFQVDTIYASGIVGSNIYESINYDCQSLTTNVLAGMGIITATQTTLPGISYIEYNLYNSGPTLVETITTTGLAPAVQFAPVSNGTYSIKMRMGTLINGVMLYSDDPTQLNAMCSTTGIVVS